MRLGKDDHSVFPVKQCSDAVEWGKTKWIVWFGYCHLLVDGYFTNSDSWKPDSIHPTAFGYCKNEIV